VPHSGGRGGPDESSRLLRVALWAAREVDDDLRPVDGRIDPLPRRQVDRDVLDRLPGCRGPFQVASAQDTDGTSGLDQPGDYMPPERPRAAGHQDRRHPRVIQVLHRRSPCHLSGPGGLT
jgi:hypothetical protein